MRTTPTCRIDVTVPDGFVVCGCKASEFLACCYIIINIYVLKRVGEKKVGELRRLNWTKRQGGIRRRCGNLEELGPRINKLTLLTYSWWSGDYDPQN